MPVGRGVRSRGIIHARERIFRRQPAIHKRNQRALPPRLHLLLGRIGNQHGVVIRRIRQRSSRRTRIVIRVGVREKQPIPRRWRGAHRNRVVLARPSWRRPIRRSMRSFGIREASSARIAPVRSVDWSFTTITSPTSACAATDSTARAIEASSLRAGMMAETKVFAVPLRGGAATTARFRLAAKHLL